ncbi:MAG TPA: alpha/beta hydrolase-fold protein [Blastocatellia bacterium]|nr:alpha/beta hydrolase-fold protein [Blastocatellia bacterium]
MNTTKRIVTGLVLLAFALPFAAIFTGFGQAPPAPPAALGQASSEDGVDYGSLQSSALGRELRFALQLPASYEKDKKRKYPVLYFLHGMNGNEGEFQRRGVASTVNRLRQEGKIGEFIIVAPAGENSFYINSKNGLRYEDAIIKDLIPYIEKTYRAIGTTEGRAIQGISMGGFGALSLAFRHPEMFSSVTAHSSALFEELPKPNGDDRRSQFMSRLIGNMYGTPPDEDYFRSYNPLFLAESNASAIEKAGLKVYFDVGDQDRYGFQGSNKALDERLSKAGVTHEFHVFPGNHGWEYMISVADHSYEFLWKNFKAGTRA